MASQNAHKADDERPQVLQTSKSFSRMDNTSSASPLRSSRAATIQNGALPEMKISDTMLSESSEGPLKENEEAGGVDSNVVPENDTTAVDELPIELVSLTDTFIDSLSAKIHPTPPNMEKLSKLFQDFYTVAATHINTHISTLSSRQHRANSPSPSASSLSSTASRLRAKAASISNKDRPKLPLERIDSDQQMLTAEEIADRKRARKALEEKRVALEEAVERRACEKTYQRIWRHRSTQDEEKDEKLRSKTAALSVVGIGLADLGVNLGSDQDGDSSKEDKEEEVRQWLEGARAELIAMNDEQYPLGKLQHLKAAHKSIVDTLSHFHPSSSADEIMPMLIYTLITSRPEGINVISNLYFIQRFRCESKIDGEAAYCLTNLEAAITFLETVDLATLRADENQSGPVKGGSARLVMPEPPASGPLPSPSLVGPGSSTTAPSDITAKADSPGSTLKPAATTPNRRLSGLFQPPSIVLGAAGDAVFNTADQGFKSIGNSLGDSYKFLVGKLKERQEQVSGSTSNIIVPRTLDDARKLISTPSLEDDGPASGASSLHTPEQTEKKVSNTPEKLEDRVLNIIGGRSATRDRSVDSAASSGSGRRAVSLTEQNEKSQQSTPSSSNPAIVESMRNLGNSLNPMTRIAGMGMMRGFGRPAAPTTPTKAIPDSGLAELTTAFPDLAPVLPPKEIKKVAPPIKRFMELQNPGELRINEVLDLLRDYRRLAGALKDLGAI
ncbi:hypothetical protein F5884DRAFT_804558 [Xylogone sp. PMI_703]|nr:hypothetical protein F5884DRAFT_804558 [Xylogone sp. PMI_703]